MMSISQEDRIRGLAECLGDAYDGRALYELRTDRDFKIASALLLKMLDLRVFRWARPKKGPWTVVVDRCDEWKLEAVQRSLAKRVGRRSVRISTTVVQ